jgi:hypothetical protein
MQVNMQLKFWQLFFWAILHLLLTLINNFTGMRPVRFLSAFEEWLTKAAKSG